MVQTAAFALCNMIRGQNPRLNEAFDSGIVEPVLLHLTSPVCFGDHNDHNSVIQLYTSEVATLLFNIKVKAIVVEVTWLLTYLTAQGEPYLKILIEAGLIQSLVSLNAFQKKTFLFIS